MPTLYQIGLGTTDGKPAVDEATFVARLDACGLCNRLEENWLCREAGVDLMWCAILPDFDCPIGKWAGEAPAPQQSPGMLAKAMTFASAVANHVAAGMPTASPELKAARLAVCAGCDQFQPPDTCAVCGCNLAIKAGWLGEKCPLDKWPEPEQEK